MPDDFPSHHGSPQQIVDVGAAGGGDVPAAPPISVPAEDNTENAGGRDPAQGESGDAPSDTSGPASDADAGVPAASDGGAAAVDGEL
jgi:hypothetical protein